MENAPAFQFYPKDWLFITECFSSETRGLFLVLACFMWLSELQDSVPNDDELICMDLKIDESVWKGMKKIALKKGILVETEDGFLSCPMLTKILENQLERRAKNAENGKKGGRPKNPKKPNGFENKANESPSSSTSSSTSFASNSLCDDSVESHGEKPTVSKDETQEFLDLATWMEQEIKVVSPSFKRDASLNSWAKDLRLMVEKDSRTPEQIRTVMRWVVNDTFWRGNILSPAKLRKQFSQLEIKMKPAGLRAVPATGPYRPNGTTLPGHQIKPAEMRKAGLVKDF